MNDLEGASSLLSQMGLGQLGASALGGEGRSSGGNGASTGNSTSVSSAPTAVTTNSSKKDESSAAPKSGTSSASKPSVQLQDLQKILGSIQPATPGTCHFPIIAQYKKLKLDRNNMFFL